ncbi:MAG: 16S rRNA (cytosine(1402)-N(4))-methyltransferase RsmH [Lentisphaeria bacterium]|jgi:16S rRNA (cytosine1402-N4)-methyltransferase|nr:16S rRNA (cytosine(1402)-N(4))-methyltransferase RsmH [Lentisphaeria bacterium]
MPFIHQTVFLNEAAEILGAVPGRRFVDGTLGGGGHAAALLTRRPEAELLGIDRDPAAIAAAAERLAPFGDRVHLRHDCFSNLDACAESLGWHTFDALLLDLGVSSPQIDSPERGFSFRFDGPLDMRMDPSTATETAADLLNNLPEAELADLLYTYGEERLSRRIARAIVARRQEKPWRQTAELAGLLENIIGRRRQHGLHPATRSFQALRIAVNHELDELENILPRAASRLNPGGRCAVITFHSLEDRIVKNFFRRESATCVCPPGLPVCVCGKQATMAVLTRKALRPSEAETQANPRSSCAKLRAACKL